MIDIFIAYSHTDLAFKDELKKFMRPLLREGRISMWDDSNIEAGQDWDARIKERLYGAGIVLLLVSSDSLASDYFYGKEVAVSLERHSSGQTRVVPVILRHCDWKETPLGSLEALPEKGRPVVEWPTRDQAFQDVVSRLRRVVEELENQCKTEAAQAETLRHFRAACAAADHLFEKKNWVEARVAYGSALEFYLPGFMPDRSALAARQADCDKNMKAEKEAESQLQRAEKERLAQEKRALKVAARNEPVSTSAASGSRSRLLAGIGLGALLVFVLLLWFRGNRDNGMQKQSREDQQTAVPTREENMPQTPEHKGDDQKAFDQATDAGNIPAWESFISKYPNSPRMQDATRQLGILKNKVNTLIKEANSYIVLKEIERAKDDFNTVLKIDPVNKTAIEKLHLLK